MPSAFCRSSLKGAMHHWVNYAGGGALLKQAQAELFQGRRQQGCDAGDAGVCLCQGWAHPVVNVVDGVALVGHEDGHVQEHLVQLQHGGLQLRHLVMPRLHVVHCLLHLQHQPAPSTLACQIRCARPSTSELRSQRKSQSKAISLPPLPCQTLCPGRNGPGGEGDRGMPPAQLQTAATLSGKATAPRGDTRWLR